MLDMTTYLNSKKTKSMLLGLVTVVVTYFATQFGLDAETANHIATLFTAITSSYLVGQGLADGLSAGATSSAAKPAVPVQPTAPTSTNPLSLP